MADMQNRLNDLGKESLETALTFARLSMANAERMVRLQLDAARAFIEDNAAQAKAMAEASDPRQLAELRARAAEATMERAIGYSKEFYEMASTAQAEVAKLMEGRVAQFNDEMLTAMQQALKSTPGSDAALHALRSTLAASTAAVENLTKVARQMTETAADNAFKSARDTASAVKATGRKK